MSWGAGVAGSDASAVAVAAIDRAPLDPVTSQAEPAAEDARAAGIDDAVDQDRMPFSGPLTVEQAVSEMLKRAVRVAPLAAAAEPVAEAPAEPAESAYLRQPLVLEVPEFTAAPVPAAPALADPAPDPAPTPTAAAAPSARLAAPEPEGRRIADSRRACARRSAAACRRDRDHAHAAAPRAWGLAAPEPEAVVSAPVVEAVSAAPPPPDTAEATPPEHAPEPMPAVENPTASAPRSARRHHGA